MFTMTHLVQTPSIYMIALHSKLDYYSYIMSIVYTTHVQHHPKSIKSSSWTTSSPRRLFDQSAISIITSLPKSACNLLNSSLMLDSTADQSPKGGAGVLIGTTFAFLLGQSLGDLDLADLGKMGGASSVEVELKVGPGPTPGAGCGVSLVEFVFGVDTGYPPSAVLKFGMMKGLIGSLECVFMASMK